MDLESHVGEGKGAPDGKKHGRCNKAFCCPQEVELGELAQPGRLLPGRSWMAIAERWMEIMIFAHPTDTGKAIFIPLQVLGQNVDWVGCGVTARLWRNLAFLITGS